MRLCGWQGGDTLVTKLDCFCSGQPRGASIFVAGQKEVIWYIHSLEPVWITGVLKDSS